MGPGVTARIANGGLRDEAANPPWELHARPPLRKLRVELSKRRGLLCKIANVMRERLRPWLSHLALYRCDVFIREPPSVMKPYAFVATPIPPPRRHRRSSHGVLAPGPAPHVPVETQCRDLLPDPVPQPARGGLAVPKPRKIDLPVLHRFRVEPRQLLLQPVAAHEDGGAVRGLQRQELAVVLDPARAGASPRPTAASV